MVQTLSRVRETGSGVTGERSLVVVVCAIRFDMKPSKSLSPFSLLVLIQTVSLVRRVYGSVVLRLVQKDVEGLLIDSCLGELNLGFTKKQRFVQKIATLCINSKECCIEQMHSECIFTLVCFFSVA